MSGQDIESRLDFFEYDKSACEAAIRGEKIPHALGLQLTRRCSVRGIRYHPGYGEELRGALPEFTRALNARSIMSNLIPSMSSEIEFPYCIWHPQVATEATYRELVCRYPNLTYQVGRACAVAGYLDLYNELDILPEVHIAEEAREAGNMAIYDSIVSKPVRYAVMDDYTRTVSATPRFGACLNGDTAVQPDYAVLADANISGGSSKDDIEKRVAELNGKVIRINWHEVWKRGSIKGLQVVLNKVSGHTSRAISSDFDGLYEGLECNAAGIEVFGSMPEDWRNFPPDPLLKLDYDHWP